MTTPTGKGNFYLNPAFPNHKPQNSHNLLHIFFNAFQTYYLEYCIGIVIRFDVVQSHNARQVCGAIIGPRKFGLLVQVGYLLLSEGRLQDILWIERREFISLKPNFVLLPVSLTPSNEIRDLVQK